MALVIAGRLAPLDRTDPDGVFKGRVYLDDSGSIDNVTAGNAPVPAGFATAPVIDVGDAFVLPGLIRSAQSHRLQHAASLGRANTNDAV